MNKHTHGDMVSTEDIHVSEIISVLTVDANNHHFVCQGDRQDSAELLPTQKHFQKTKTVVNSFRKIICICIL